MGFCSVGGGKKKSGCRWEKRGKGFVGLGSGSAMGHEPPPNPLPPKVATNQNPKPHRHLFTHQINHLFRPHLHRHNYLISLSPTLAEIDGLSNYDFVVVDMEHDHGVVSESTPSLHTLAVAQTPAILHLPETSAAWAKKALDLGLQGIMFPMIESSQGCQKGGLIYSMVRIYANIIKICIVDEGIGVVAFEEGQI
ncbi:PREDICTED: 2-keto-3-deoxy-L-rhamnonate aldolase [Prunus dulcis]|uniref:PREDICTED: 2-keto-3-deoxy-L-rhamnonate aldolase n=1 Tax=Prunus dulcis TaxID=3755 RepID=A0A5E4GB19_PRUDU|nr:PREDICTED: 2-keto-3-deoxy-L-rhamnonate aldolase [Prunus dulcis]